MNIVERREAMVDYIRNFDSVTTNDLLAKFDESPATIRRDLVFLEEQGIITHSRGYVKIVPATQIKEASFTTADYAIAAEAAKLIPQRAFVCIDSGTEAIALAKSLQNREDISVVTNSLPVLRSFSGTNVETYGIGGKLAPRQQCMLGADTVNYVNSIRVQYSFITTTGIRGTSGLSCVTPEQADIKAAFLRIAEHRVLLAKGKRFDKDALREFASFEDIDVIVTDRPIESEDLDQRLKDLGVKVIVARV